MDRDVVAVAAEDVYLFVVRVVDAADVIDRVRARDVGRHVLELAVRIEQARSPEPQAATGRARLGPLLQVADGFPVDRALDDVVDVIVGHTRLSGQDNDILDFPEGIDLAPSEHVLVLVDDKQCDRAVRAHAVDARVRLTLDSESHDARVSDRRHERAQIVRAVLQRAVRQRILVDLHARAVGEHGSGVESSRHHGRGPLVARGFDVELCRRERLVERRGASGVLIEIRTDKESLR